jgi:hypothetical protein
VTFPKKKKKKRGKEKEEKEAKRKIILRFKTESIYLIQAFEICKFVAKEVISELY